MASLKSMWQNGDCSTFLLLLFSNIPHSNANSVFVQHLIRHEFVTTTEYYTTKQAAKLLVSQS